MKYLMILLCVNTIFAAPIDKTIDELLDNDIRKELNIPEYDPFKRTPPLLKKKAKNTRPYKPLKAQLSAVMNNKAFITGQWYKKGEWCSEGKLIKITKDSVHLKEGTQTKILRLKKNKESMFTIRQKDIK